MFDLLKNKFKALIKKTEEHAEEVEKVPEEMGERAKIQEEKLEVEKEPEKEAAITIKTKIKSLLSKTVVLSEQDLEQILSDFELELIQSDVAVETAGVIVDKLKERIEDKEIDKGKISDFVRQSLKDVLLEILRQEEKTEIIERIKNSEKPCVIVFFGINGTGKTTTIAKFAKYLMNNKLSVVIAAGDTFRAGAIEQLQKHADALGVKLISHKKGADAAAVIFDAVAHAKARNVDVVLADTAGRMQTNVNLMDEMKKIIRVNKPHLKLFVGDALTGNDAVEQAREFNDAVGIDGIILAKLDADAKGGCALSITNETKKPILFVGVGQRYEDLQEFDAEWFVEKIV